MRKTTMCLMLGLTIAWSAGKHAEAAVGYSNDFDGGEIFGPGVTGGFGGAASIEGVEGYAGLGTGANVFAGSFLRNSTFGNPQTFTTLTLNNLPAHTSIDLSFLLGIVDSWDGTSTSVAPDFLNVRIDGVSIFSETFDNFAAADQSYIAPGGGELASRVPLGFNASWEDSAYNMGLDSTFDSIPHSANSLTIDWFASGGGWQGGDDESWAIDNVEVILNDTVIPEPVSSLIWLGVAMGVVGTGWSRSMRGKRRRGVVDWRTNPA